MNNFKSLISTLFIINSLFIAVSYGKVFGRCELAHKLYNVHGFSYQSTAKFVCIAQHESNLNTEAVGRLNLDGSLDHGIFQISDIYWCSRWGSGKGCNLSCSQLQNNDISDDVECLKIIFNEQQRLYGDGYSAWTMHQRYCLGNVNYYIDGCL